MMLFVPLLMALAAACSNGQSQSQAKFDDPYNFSGTIDAAIPLAGRVTDAANIFTEEEKLALSDRLARFEEMSKHQMVVVTVSSLGGRDIAGFTRDLANAWGIGRKDVNDGVVVLVAPNERKVRIAVGQGLENLLPNSACQAIIDQRILPNFREGNLVEGVEEGVGALIQRLTPRS